LCSWGRWAYEPSRLGVKGLLSHVERAVVVTTMNTPKWAYRCLYGNAVQRALVRGTLRKCGVRKVGWVALSPVSHVSYAKRQAWLKQVGDILGGQGTPP
jgi:NAD(P)H dehydrogenase (quinone)